MPIFTQKEKFYIIIAFVAFIVIGISIVFNIGQIRDFLTSALNPPAQFVPTMPATKQATLDYQ